MSQHYNPPSYDSLFGNPVAHSDNLVRVQVEDLQPEVLIDPIVLPTDVVSQIFYSACQPIPGDAEWRREFYPLHLGCISRRWREVAWATSELWQTVVLRVRSGSYEIQSVLLKEWLERAKGRPLDIYFDTSRGEPNPDLSMWGQLEMRGVHLSATQIIRSLQQHSEQWRCIGLCVPTSEWLYIFFRSPRDGGLNDFNFPSRLTSISMHCSSILGLVHGVRPVDLHHALSLRSLAFSSCAIGPSFFDIYPTTQITYLVLTDILQIDLAKLLEQLPKLKEATFVGARFIASHGQGFRRAVTHKELSTLTIQCRSEHQISVFLRNVADFPKLEKLSIRVPAAVRFDRCLSPFVARSKCSLTSLSLEFQITDGEEYHIIEFLYSLPSLVELHVRDYKESVSGDVITTAGIGRQFFEALHPDEDLSYVPNLEILSYEGSLAVQAIDFIEPLIIRARMRGPDSMANGRSGPVAILRSAKIKANQYSEVSQFSIAEYMDPYYVWEVIRMMECGILTLVNMDGSIWE